MEIRRKSLVVLLGIGIAGVIGASAASLNLTSESLGADATVVAACDTDGIAVGYTYGYDTTTQEYTVSSVNLSGVDAACNGLDYDITLAGDNPAPAAPTTLFTGSGVLSVDGSGNASIAVSPAASAEALTDLALVIAG